MEKEDKLILVIENGMHILYHSSGERINDIVTTQIFQEPTQCHHRKATGIVSVLVNHKDKALIAYTVHEEGVPRIKVRLPTGEEIKCIRDVRQNQILPTEPDGIESITFQCEVELSYDTDHKRKKRGRG